jgi:tetratricopeptide (TPR) repeat protein
MQDSYSLDELKLKIAEAERADSRATSIVLLREYVRRTDDVGYYRYLLAENLRSIGNPIEALQHFGRVANVPPDRQCLLQLSLAELYAALGDRDSAERHFGLAIDHSVGETDARVCFARFLAGSGRVLEAISALKPARALLGDQTEVCMLLGNYCRALGDYESAIAYFAEAHRMSAGCGSEEMMDVQRALDLTRGM